MYNANISDETQKILVARENAKRIVEEAGENLSGSTQILEQINQNVDTLKSDLCQNTYLINVNCCIKTKIENKYVETSNFAETVYKNCQELDKTINLKEYGNCENLYITAADTVSKVKENYDKIEKDLETKIALLQEEHTKEKFERENKYKKILEEIEQLQNEYNILEKEKQEKNEVVSKLLKEIEELQFDIEKTTKDIESIKLKKTEAFEDVNNKMKDIDNEYSTVVSEKNQLIKAIEEIKKQNFDLVNQIAVLNENKSAYAKNKEEIKIATNEIENQILSFENKFNTEILDLEKTIKEKLDLFEIYSTENLKMKEEKNLDHLLTINEEVKRVQADIDYLEKNKPALTDKIKNIHETAKHLKQTIMEFDYQIIDRELLIKQKESEHQEQIVSNENKLTMARNDFKELTQNTSTEEQNEKKKCSEIIEFTKKLTGEINELEHLHNTLCNEEQDLKNAKEEKIKEIDMLTDTIRTKTIEIRKKQKLVQEKKKKNLKNIQKARSLQIKRAWDESDESSF